MPTLLVFTVVKDQCIYRSASSTTLYVYQYITDEADLCVCVCVCVCVYLCIHLDIFQF